ncbi:hypothetical protein FRB99_003614 [Tulasnella sp. 403]|nr:hypothetical protein FRB99_003614 [Tulasnella sp. 403]
MDLTAQQTEWMPTEIYDAIFCALVFLGTNDAIKTLFTCRLTCSYLKSVAEASLVWETLYKRRWKQHDREREQKRRAKFAHDPFQRFLHRAWIDHRVRTMVYRMSLFKKGRFARAQILGDYGEDALEQLRKLANFDPSPTRGSHWLSDAYWATQTIGALERRAAMNRLSRITNGEHFELEEGLSVLSSFFGVGYSEIKEKLDNMAERCKEDLFLTLRDLSDTQTICIAICDWMRSQGFVPSGSRETYLDLDNHFIHKMPNERGNLPLTMVAVFVALARRLGLDARPVSFPRHVHAWVKVHDKDESIAVDVFNSKERPILTPDLLEASFRELHMAPERLSTFLQPTSTGLMLERAARNVASSLRTLTPYSKPRYWDVVRSCYAMVSVLSYFANASEELLRHLTKRIQYVFPVDIPIVINLELYPNEPRDTNASKALADIIRHHKIQEYGPPPKSLLRIPTMPYFVGLVVIHNGGEMCVIIGWNIDGTWKSDDDNRRSSPEEPVYELSCTSTASEIREDAQIRRTTQKYMKPFPAPDMGNPKGWGLYYVVTDLIQDLGRIFRSAVVSDDRYLWFIPNDELAARYPDDTAAGRKFMGIAPDSAI